MTNPGQFRDHLNWSFKSKIFAHMVRIPFPSYVRWERFTTLWLYQSGEGEQGLEQPWDLAAKQPVQSRFREFLLLICILSFGKRSFINLIKSLLIPTEACEILIAVKCMCSCDTNFSMLAYSIQFLSSSGTVFLPLILHSPRLTQQLPQGHCCDRQGTGLFSKLCLWKMPHKHQILLMWIHESTNNPARRAGTWFVWSGTQR